MDYNITMQNAAVCTSKERLSKILRSKLETVSRASSRPCVCSRTQATSTVVIHMACTRSNSDDTVWNLSLTATARGNSKWSWYLLQELRRVHPDFGPSHFRQLAAWSHCWNDSSCTRSTQMRVRSLVKSGSRSASERSRKACHSAAVTAKLVVVNTTLQTSWDVCSSSDTAHAFCNNKVR